MQKRRATKQALQLRAAINIVWKSGPLWTLANIALLVVQGFLPLASLYLMKLVLDEVTVGLGSSPTQADFGRVAVLIALAGGVALLQGLASVLSRLVNEAQVEAVTDHVRDILHAKSVEVDLEYYEHAEYYDKLHRAQREAPYRPVQIVNGLFQVGQSSLSLAVMAALLLSLHWAVALVLLLAALPGVLVRLRYSHILFQWNRKSTSAQRQAWYYEWMLVDGRHAKEIRLFNLGPLFIERARRLRRLLRLERLRIATRRSRAELVTQVSENATMFGVYAFIAYRALQGTITIGDLVMYYQAFQRGQGFLTGVLRGLAGLYEDSMFLAYLDEFLALEPKIVAPPNPQLVPRPIREGVTFSDVSFRYPMGSAEVLQHINLTIRPGEVIALVGENGAGKTTLVKLLCRLYDPDQGAILVDNTDLRCFDPLGWRREVSVIFQDFLHYNVSAQENIWFGNIELPPTEDQIITAAQKAGVHDVISNMKHDYQTVLGKMLEEGEELSIGQWQKIALARAFLRDAQMIILDEPASALDAKSEYALSQGFRELIGNKSAVLISHRLSTVRMADCIYVLENQTIAEQGTHDELMRRGGIYATLFSTQAESYLESRQ